VEKIKNSNSRSFDVNNINAFTKITSADEYLEAMELVEKLITIVEESQEKIANLQRAMDNYIRLLWEQEKEKRH